MTACNGEQLQLIRGDTLLMTVKVASDAITDQASCRLVVADDANALLDKSFTADTSGVFKVWLDPTETQTLEVGEYRFSIVIEDATTTPPLKKQVMRSLRIFQGVAS